MKASRSVVSAVLVVSALGLSACGTAGGVKTAGDPAAGPSTGAPAGKSPAVDDKSAKVGSAITLKGNGATPAEVKVTVVKVVNKASGSDEFTKSAAGKRFVAVQFVIENVGQYAYEDSPSNGSKVIDAEDQQFPATFQESNAGPALPSGAKLAPGKSLKGFLTYEVPTSAKLTGVQFGVDSGFGETGEWRLS